jgi:NitT/TauT family transport system substrate-binding protein
VKDVNIVNLEPQAAANAMIAGTANLDAAMTYEPYLSAVRAKPEAGKIIATTLDYPMVMDTFGCTPKFLADNPKAAQAWPTLLRRAGDDQGRPEEELRDHGRRRQAERRGLREEPEAYLRWQDRAANQKFFAGEHAQFSKEAAELLLEAGIIRRSPT